MATGTIPTSAPSPRTGQRGKLALAFERRGGRSVLAERYACAPFGNIRAAYPDGSGVPEVQMTNPAGGILGGDALELEVSLSPGSSAVVTTQGAAKAYRGPPSSQTARFEVGEGAYLEYLPHHLTPYAGSSHRQSAEFLLADGARLLAWEAYSAGRLARGERFAFDRLSARTRVYRGDRPEAADGFDLPGGGEPFVGYSYLGAVFAVTEDAAGLAETLHGLLQNGPGALASASAPSESLCAARVLAGSAPALYRALNRCREAARDSLELPPGRGVW